MNDYLKIEPGRRKEAAEALKSLGFMAEEVEEISYEFIEEAVDRLYERIGEGDLRQYYDNSGTSLSYEDYVSASRIFIADELINSNSALKEFYEAVKDAFYNIIEDSEEIEEIYELINRENL